MNVLVVAVAVVEMAFILISVLLARVLLNYYWVRTFRIYVDTNMVPRSRSVAAAVAWMVSFILVVSV